MLKAVLIAVLIGSACLTAPAVVHLGRQVEAVELTSSRFSPVDKALECAEVPEHARKALAAAYRRDVFTLIDEVPKEHVVKRVTVDVVAHGCLVVPGDPLVAITNEQILKVGPAAGFVESSWMSTPKFYVVQELAPENDGLRLVFLVITLPASAAFIPPESPPKATEPVRIA